MTAYAYDIGGWYAGQVADGSPRSTPFVPLNISQTTIPGAMRSNWTGYEWVDHPYSAPVLPDPPGPVVPAQVTRRQAKQALLLAGLLDAVEPAIAAIADPIQRGLLQIEWADSQVFERQRPSLIALAGALGLNAAQLDALFVAAGDLA